MKLACIRILSRRTPAKVGSNLNSLSDLISCLRGSPATHQTSEFFAEVFLIVCIYMSS